MGNLSIENKNTSYEFLLVKNSLSRNLQYAQYIQVNTYCNLIYFC